MLHVKQFTFNPFAENTFIVYNDNGACFIIDPGMCETGEENEISDFITSENLKPKLLLNTHCHIDHVLGNFFISERYQLEPGIHSKELAVLQSVKSYAADYGFPGFKETNPSFFIDETTVLSLDGQKHATTSQLPTATANRQLLTVLFVPGHSPGHIAFVSNADNFCIGGDVLFRTSIGRTDLPGGNYSQLIESIRKKIFTLPDSMIIYPGHGPETTVGFEKKYNPFLTEEMNLG